METNIWLDIIKVAAGILTGGGLWAWIKAREDKRKTPYDMLRDLLAEQKETENENDYWNTVMDMASAAKYCRACFPFDIREAERHFSRRSRSRV